FLSGDERGIRARRDPSVEVASDHAAAIVGRRRRTAGVLQRQSLGRRLRAVGAALERNRVRRELAVEEEAELLIAQVRRADVEAAAGARARSAGVTERAPTSVR